MQLCLLIDQDVLPVQVHSFYVVRQRVGLHRVERRLLLFSDRGDDLLNQKVGQGRVIETGFLELKATFAVPRQKLSSNGKVMNARKELCEKLRRHRLGIHTQNIKINRGHPLQSVFLEGYKEALQTWMILPAQLQGQEGIQLALRELCSLLLLRIGLCRVFFETLYLEAATVRRLFGNRCRFVVGAAENAESWGKAREHAQEPQRDENDAAPEPRDPHFAPSACSGGIPNYRMTLRVRLQRVFVKKLRNTSANCLSRSDRFV